ncbi:hypothetical protein FZEAL_5436 [Fusarium zealandicum]|uniref:Uncharacterized protein n=1 Tax=Fusarium zealandicum TaxID=1053134 RepID=A0A8H4UJS0_9HYPO|nr:hypothetical protein FZEAL_5436 [Fusarium zealandicum]
MSNPQFSFRDTTFHGPSLLRERRETVRRVTVKTQLEQLRNTGRYECFMLKWHPIYDEEPAWPVPKSLFWDSDIAKWIEGACYFLVQNPDHEVDAAVKELVEDIRSAQQDDGYLNVYFSVVEPKARWSNIRDQHELYNAGHLIEAAIAHKECYGNNLLIEPIEKYVQLLNKIFGPGPEQRHAYPGHPEIELALLRLYKATSSVSAYNLAKYFLEERGNPTGQDGLLYYDWEEQQRGDNRWQRPNPYPEVGSHWYNQAHAPILKQDSVEGHSVRAMYLLTGAADLLYLHTKGVKSLPDAESWSNALNRLWSNMVDKKMSVTGGIGAIKQWEGFGIDYFLPQGTDEGGCYNETCASIGVMMLAERLLELDLDSKYADIMELCLYNGVMTAMDLGGKAFTYVNQLASSEKDKSERCDWFECACCPPNLMRLFGSLGGYLWDYGGEDEAFVNVHLFTTASLTFSCGEQNVRLKQTSNWPWDGKVSFDFSAPSTETTIRLRIPGWAEGDYKLEPQSEDSKIEKGYLVLPPSYTSKNPSFVFEVGGFAPRLIAPHPYTNQNTLTVARGPLIYCVEDFDNEWVADHFKNTVLSSDAKLTEQEHDLEGSHSYVAIHGTGWERNLEAWHGGAQGHDPSRAAKGDAVSLGDERKLVFVPYYLRANRGGRGQMRVGLLRK